VKPARGALVGALLAVGIVGIVGCGRSPSSGGTTMGGPQGSGGLAPLQPPVDHLAPGELLEGPDHAYGIALPRGVKIDAAFATVVYASGVVAVDPLVHYLQARVQEGDLRQGPTSATFNNVLALGGKGPRLAIHVVSVRERTDVEISDETPPVLPNLPDEAARWKHVGLTPDGRLADPTHLE
jgi:hypothetical protein